MLPHKAMKLWVLAIACLIVPVEASAQVNSPGARTLFARAFLYRTDWRFSETAFDDSNRASLVAGPRRNRTLVWENTLVYGFGPSLMGVATVPVVNRSETPASDQTASRGTGVGDPTFLVQFDGLYRKNRPGGFTRLAAFFGVRAPWGQEPFSSEATDFVQGLILTRSTPRWWVSTDLQWTATTEGRGVARGDALQLDASLMYRARTYPRTQDLFLVLELNAIHRARDITNGQTIDTSGGRVVFLSPGLEIFLRRNFVVELSAQFPVNETLHASRATPQWTLVVGFRFLY